MGNETVVEILALLAEYGQTVDDARWVEHRELWAEDCHLVVFENDHAGREAIVAFMQSAEPGKHLTGVPSLQLHGDRAQARSDYAFFNEELQLYNAGTYVDDLVREDGRWRISRRQIQVRLRRTA